VDLVFPAKNESEETVHNCHTSTENILIERRKAKYCIHLNLAADEMSLHSIPPSITPTSVHSQFNFNILMVTDQNQVMTNNISH